MPAETPPADEAPEAPTTRFPDLPRYLLAVIPTGFACAGIWLALGHGRLHSFYYWCVLLAILSVLVSLFAAAGWSYCRARTPRSARWSERACGFTVAFIILLGLYLVAQAACWILNERRVAPIERTGTHSTGEIYQSNRLLGYVPRPDSEAGERLVVDGEVVFDYTYRTDAFRRRVVPAQRDDGTPRERAVVFFGGSYTFGEGVDDADTLPNQLALHMPEVAMYNYGFSGYGPHQMLARLEATNLRDEVREREAIGIYVFIPNHVRRVIGAYSTISWSRHSPYYVLGPDGEPLRLGSFQGERARRTAWYEFLKGDHVVQYFTLDIPRRLQHDHFQLTAAVAGRAAVHFRRQFQSARFYVMLFPRSPQDEFDARKMRTLFEREGLQVLDYTRRLTAPPNDLFFLPHDSHPRPRAHAIIAEMLARDLAARSGRESR